MKHIAIFASGSGSNFENIYNYFKNNDLVKVSLVICNNPKAYVLERAERLGVESVVVDKESFYKTDLLANHLSQKKIDWIVLAGFLLLIPDELVRLYPNRIINIHPALLPKYGGKGMYGKHVHRAVKANKEHESGITIHYVNNQYDKGEIIFQAACELDAEDDEEVIAQKVGQLEQQYFPRTIEALIAET